MRRPLRGALENGALALGFLLLSALAAEALMRWRVPWLLPGASGYSPATGLPAGWLEKTVAGLRANPPDLVFVGDSFVKTGLEDDGWISGLRRLTGRSIGGLGVDGGCPSQYWLMYDALRGAGLQTPIVVVLYAGNDLVDEAIWARVGSDRSQYEPARLDFYADPARPTYWPCFQKRPDADRLLAKIGYGLERHSALYRALLLKLGGATDEAGVARFMDARCDRPPWAERVGDRVFFFRLHDASVDPDQPALARARAAILTELGRRDGDHALAVAPVLDREENCRAFHHHPVTRAAPLIDALRAEGVQVLDANPDLARECAVEEIYVADGHWNARGHGVFASAIDRELARVGLLEGGDRSPQGQAAGRRRSGAAAGSGVSARG